MAGGYGVERFGQAYYGTEGLDLAGESLIISQALRDVLSGDDPRAVECYVDVTVGGVAVPKIESIDIERGLDGRIGLARVYVLCSADAIPSGIATNATVTITAGIRFAGADASAQIFSGRVDEWTPPDLGDIRGTLIAYDAAKILDEASVSGTASGDYAAWVELQASALSMDAGFSVVMKGSAVELGRSYISGFRRLGGPYPLLAFSTLLEAVNVLPSITEKRFCCVNGAGDLVVVDPAYVDTEGAQFDFSKVISSREVTRASERYNRVKYSNFVGYAAGVLNTLYEGTYNDTSDQAIYGVMELSGGVLNNLPISDAEMQLYAASVASVSQRRKWEIVTRFNPFVDIGSRHVFPAGNAQVGSIAHSLRSTGLWTTKMEVWGDAA